MSKYFEGWYLKHQKAGSTISFIPGRTDHSAFIQIITSDRSYHVFYPLNEYECSKDIRVGNSEFSENGIRVHINDENINAYGEISYSNQTPIKYDIMGVFKYFPMECYHGVISMRHELDGFIHLNGEAMDFTKGIGYIEMDRGTSFPKSYVWVQCNDFDESCSIMASIADIPFFGVHFNGCICIVNYKDKEYRMATYLGVKIECYNEKRVVLKQRSLRLEIDIIRNDGHMLYAPCQGDMIKTIHESVSCEARFTFYIHDRMLFDLKSNHASFEFV